MMQQLSKGATLQGGKYIIERVLGQGGFGITYLATHSFLEKQVAIKEFFPKDFCERNGATSHITLGNANTTELVVKLKEKFLKEAKNISKLSHSNIVAIHDIFEENGTAYYLMDFIDGTSLNDKIKSGGALSEEMALKYIRTVGNAISYMHSKKMNHLDIKPANIMLRSSDDAPILIDFGLAKQYDSAGEQTSTTPVGISHGYAPVEQYRPGGVSSFTPQSDVYALGATLFALLTGQTPPHYSEILEDGLPELPAVVSNRTSRAIEHAMEIKKNKRPTTINAFIDELGETNVSANKQKTIKEKPEVTIILNDKVETIVPKDESPKSMDETMMIGDVTPIRNVSAVDESLTIDDIEFVDLGLSVKWAAKFETAQNDNQLGVGMDIEAIRMTYPPKMSKFIPSKKHFEELFSSCDWRVRRLGRVCIGYDVIGPSGNSIYMPILPIQAKDEKISRAKWRELVKEIYVLTREEFDNPDVKLKVLISGDDIRFTTFATNSRHIRLVKGK